MTHLPQAAAPPRRLFRTSPHTKDQLAPEKKKSLLANPGGLVVAVLGVVFVGYIFNVAGLQTTIDARLGTLNQSAHGHDKQVAALFIHALPVFGGLLVLLMIFAMLRGRRTSGKSAAKTRAREMRGIEAFVEAAGTQGVSPRIARASYRMMLPLRPQGQTPRHSRYAHSRPQGQAGRDLERIRLSPAAYQPASQGRRRRLRDPNHARPDARC